ncbi:ABC transporter [Streptomyces sp. CB02923]|uniref:ABC transporter ATP-binding protein n=1 Tax=Streptomyces sp. CB02923 TaxID=1718985 RepID=UPI00093D8157|nr:ABC transporter ATP-binding protein [Streptomyces sp. CB02923]OKI02567.1 ABC transporter [Streptomyces sp. CB02923]
MIRQLHRVLERGQARAVRRTVALMVVCAVAEGLSLMLLLPVLRALFGPDPASAWPWLGAFAASVALVSYLGYRSDMLGFRTGGELSRSLHHRLGDHLVRLPLGWFTLRRVGEVTGVTSRSVLAVMSVPAHQLRPVVNACCVPLTVFVALFFVDFRPALAALLCVPVVALVHHATGRATARQDAERARLGDEATGRVVEYVRAQPVLRAAGRTGEHMRLLEQALREQSRTERRSALRALPGLLGMTLTVQAALTAVLTVTVYTALYGRIGAAEAMAILVLTARCTEPLLSLAELGGALRANRGELARIEAVLREAPLPEPARPVPAAHGGITFDRVGFARGGRNVLDGLSLDVPDGHSVAIVGRSGAGKTTMLHLAARFHDVHSGAVRVGGADVRDIGTEHLMAQVSTVFQDVYLFEGSIEENVRLGRPDATDQDVRAAAAAARLDEVVTRLPQGWDTRVGEGGAALSGGERQRVTIARALLKNAPVLLLDEATSALDAENEAAIQEGLERLRSGRTVVMVAHRLHTVRTADRIAFLEDGRIVEHGTHDELVRLGGRYADFWKAAAHDAE